MFLILISCMYVLNTEQHLNLLFLLWQWKDRKIRMTKLILSSIGLWSYCCLIPLIFVTFASLVLNICEKVQSSTQKSISTSWKYLGKYQDLLLTIDNCFTSLHLAPKLNHITQGKYFLHKYQLKWKHAYIKAIISTVRCSKSTSLLSRIQSIQSIHPVQSNL